MSIFIASRRTSSVLTASPLIGPALYFGEHDGHFRADPRASRAVGLAVAFMLDLDFAVWRSPIHAEQAKAQALHAIGAARVVNHGNQGFQRLPLPLVVPAARQCFDQGENVLDARPVMSRRRTGKSRTLFPGSVRWSAENQRLLGLAEQLTNPWGHGCAGPRILVREGPGGGRFATRTRAVRLAPLVKNHSRHRKRGLDHAVTPSAGPVDSACAAASKADAASSPFRCGMLMISGRSRKGTFRSRE